MFFSNFGLGFRARFRLCSSAMVTIARNHSPKFEQRID